MSDQDNTGIQVAVLRLYAVILLLVGIGLTGGGGYLLTLGGSPYYVVCGLAVLASGFLLWQRRAAGATLYGLMLLATVIWAIWESGFSGWALMPRILAPVVLGVVLVIPWIRRALLPVTPGRGFGRCIAAVLVAVVAGAVLHTYLPPLTPADPLYQTGMGPAPAPAPVVADTQASNAQASGEWLNYGNDLGGMRFSPLTQITPENVAQLKVAWTFRVDGAVANHSIETTPLKIGNSLYICNARNDIVALDAETGKQLWRFDAHVEDNKVLAAICRGVGYYKVPNATGPCAERIITNTIDARLIALDAHDGTPCSDFGTNGQVNLLVGMGDADPGYYFVTSAPTIMQGKIVVGGWVTDNQYWGEPSGVIRAFDATTGQLAWAWDMGHPDRTGEPPAGETYTPSTPNAWPPMSADEALGLVFVPLGNATPDYFGAQRRPFDDQYSSSLVALDIATGKPRWSFQTAHHDIWDYDTQPPTAVDYESASGPVHALLVATKRGELFELDRSTGVPIKSVVEVPAPQQGAVPEERVAPTQPFSVGMPSFRGANLVEGRMWGLTPLDQLWCRIKFREARYDGPLTPPGLTPAIEAPGFMGGLEWGGVAVDPERRIVLVNSNNLPNYTQMVTREEANRKGMKRATAKNIAHAFDTYDHAQEETPYGITTSPFLSPLKVPCVQPPFGRLSAVDLTTGKLIWTQSFGTSEELGPMGLRSKLPLPIGTFNLGGGVVSRSGLFFIGASQDRDFRAYDTVTGKLLWQVGIPGGGHATPMTYMSQTSGRQFVVIAAAGVDGVHTTDGSFIVAYALPKAPAP